MSDQELVDAAIKLQHKLYECQRHNMKLRALLDECERALSDLLEDGDKTDRDNGFRVLAKLRTAQEKAAKP